jgi:hypothetical protein
MKITGWIRRQGDLMLIPRSPYIDRGHLGIQERKLKDVGRHTLKHVGENSTHAHVLDHVDLLDTEEGARWVRLSQPRVLNHVSLVGPMTEAGHAPLEVPSGHYEVRIQREWDPESFAPRWVID